MLCWLLLPLFTKISLATGLQMVHCWNCRHKQRCILLSAVLADTHVPEYLIGRHPQFAIAGYYFAHSLFSRLFDHKSRRSDAVIVESQDSCEPPGLWEAE